MSYWESSLRLKQVADANRQNLTPARWSAAAERLGTTFQAAQTFTTSYAASKHAGPTPCRTYGLGPGVAHVAHGMTKLVWKVPISGSWTVSMANFIDNAGPGGDGARMPQTFIQEPTTPKRQSFIVNYLKTFNPKNSRIDSTVSATRG